VVEHAVRHGDKVALSAEKKTEELDIDIPEITLAVDPHVASVIKKYSEEGTQPKVSDFANRADDATFLNALQTGVDGWIREIRKVCFYNLVYCLLPYL